MATTLGPPKKHMLPLFLLILSISIFALHFLFTETTRSEPEIRTTALKDPGKTLPFTFLIKVLTYNRLQSLSRCLRSLAAADYGGSEGRVHLHIYIDHFNLATNHTEVPDSLSSAREILEFIDGFEWRFGGKLVHYRTNNAGLQAQWLEAWWPSSDHEFAFIVEDDLELSPLYFKFLERVIRSYYYDDSNFSPSIYGASLQRPRFVPGKHGNKLRLDPETNLFLYQLVGTWGQLLFPKPWKEFRLWYDDHKAKDIKPFLDGMVTTGWYKRIGERIWTPWFIKFIHSRGYYNIYTNFQQEKALSVSHRDAGVNYGKTAGPDSQLLYESYVDSNFFRMQPLNSLRWYDFCFRQVVPGRVIRSMDELGAVLPSVQRDSTILLLNLFDATESVTRNLICNFEKLNIQNHIFFGPSEFLYDLARRGHPVIHADQFLNNLRAYKSMKNQNSNSKEILMEAYAIKRCLESGYSSWVVKSNVFFMEQSLNLDSILSSDNYYAGENSGLFFVRHSSAAQKLWVDEFLHNLPAIIDKVSSPDKRRNLAWVVAKSLEGKGGKMKMEMKNIDETNLAVNINADNINGTATAGRKLVYWSAQTGSDLIKKQLKELGLWLIDDEFSCRAVICHQS